MKGQRWFVSGRVQGVFFRDFVRARATELSLRGWVRNRSDGRVEVEAWGRRESLEALEQALSVGSSAARVDSVDAVPTSEPGAPSDFRVRASE